MANVLLQYWDSITKEDLEFSVGARQNNWGLAVDSSLALTGAPQQKDPLLGGGAQYSDADFVHNDHRASFVPTQYHDSAYADSTYEYRPPTSGTYHTRTQSSGHLGVVETRQPKRLSGYDSVSQQGDGFGDAAGTMGGGQHRDERAARRKSRGHAEREREMDGYEHARGGY